MAAGIRSKKLFKTIQKYDSVQGLETQQIKDYASKEWNLAKSEQGRVVGLALVDALI